MDPFSLTESELITYLTELGVDDAVTMEPNERMRTMLSLMGDDSAFPAVSPAASGVEQGMSSVLTAIPSVPTSKAVEQSFGKGDTIPTDNDTYMGLDEDQIEEHILSYCSITGSDPESARHLLEALDWDLDAAVTMHMEQGDPDSNTTGSSAIDSNAMNVGERMNPLADIPDFRGIPVPMRGMTGMGMGIGGAMAQMNAENRMGGNMQHTYFQNGNDDDDEYGDYNGGAGHYMGRMGGMGPNGPGGSSWAGNGGGEWRSGKADEYDEEGVRKPDPIRHERMIGGMDDFDPYSRADMAEVAWLFPPPRHLSYSGSFQEARTMAKDDKKWMLVNIQSHLEFSSEMMNRDTFVDETVITLLRTSFVFWQRGHTSPDAMSYMRTHSVQEGDLPHMAVIDSRTGAKIVTMKGFVSPGDLAMALLEFLEDNSFDNNKAPKQRNIDTTKDFERQVALAMGRRNFDGAMSTADSDTEREREGGSSSLKRGGDSTVDDRKSAASSDRKNEEKQNEKEKEIARSAGPSSSGGMKISDSESSSSSRHPQQDFGSLPEEPAAGDDPNVVKVCVKLPWGKQVVRRFHKSDLVRIIYAFAQKLSTDNEGGSDTGTGRSFDLCTAYPSMSLRDSLDLTIEVAGVAGSQVIMRWDI